MGCKCCKASVVQSAHSNKEEQTITEAQVSETPRLSIMENHGYTVGKTIGTGSFAVIKLAECERQQVAVKIISKIQAPTEILTRFLPREIEVVKDLSHPNLIKFIQAVETTRRVYIIMEYAENGSLLDIIRKENYIEEDPRAKLWFSQLRDAVWYCHNEGVVHRDIKCENILLDAKFDIKLTDFGFARGHMKPQSNGSPILSKTFCGSPAYASPEILSGLPYEPQMSDAWSMGVVLFVMVYGRFPFDYSNLKKMIELQSKVKFPTNPTVSKQCKSIIRKLLSPLRFRMKVYQIAEDPWLVQNK